MWSCFKRSSPARPSSPTVWVSTNVLDRTVVALRQSGSRGQAHEGVVYWAGRRAGGECFVTTCIAPAAQTTWGSFSTSSATNAEVVIFLNRAGLELIGQVHSHPGSSVDHSDGDDERALMPYEGFYSLVVPEYASRGIQPLEICGIHVFENHRFRRLRDAEITNRFRVIRDFADLRT